MPLSKPDKGEVLLKVEAIGLNRAEVMFRQGQYLKDAVFRSRLGYEAAGIVDAVGPGAGVEVFAANFGKIIKHCYLPAEDTG